MSTTSTKKTTLLKKVLIPTIITMFIVNFIAVYFVGVIIQKELLELEVKYLDEILDNISSTIESRMTDYIHTAQVVSRMDSIKTILTESDASNPMHTNPNAQKVILELNNICNDFSGTILTLGILDIEQDGYLIHTGDFSDESFSFKSRPYYSAVTTRSNVITDPYLDVVTNSMVVSACVPVFSDNNEVLGAIIIDISTAFISDLVSANEYGISGKTLIIDSTDSVLAYTDKSYLSQSFNSLNYSGSQFTTQKANPTGELITFTANGVNQVGALGFIKDFGWTLVVSLNWSEFYETIIVIRVIMLVIQSLSIAFSAVVCSNIIRKQLAPIKILNEAMSEIVKGDMHYVINHQSNDEIGELTENLRTTIKNLADYITEIGRILKEFGYGNFQVEKRMTFLGDFIEIQVAMDEFIVLISDTLSDLKGTVKQVSLSSNHVSEGAQNLANGAIEQSSNIHELNGVVSDITGKINENSKNATEISYTAKDIQVELSESNSQMQKMIDSMLDINEKSAEIQTITKNIEDIAFQTDILALNAAVEASRAGQHGKGFAIVAEEVRNLAAKISEEVQRTEDLVAASVQAVEIGCGFADDTAKGLEKVTENINEFADKLQLISSASQEQAKAIAEINHGIESITGIMQHNTAISEESAATAEELSTQSNRMNESISKFKTK